MQDATGCSSILESGAACISLMWLSSGRLELEVGRCSCSVFHMYDACSGRELADSGLIELPGS